MPELPCNYDVGQDMGKMESQMQIRRLVHVWRTESRNDETPPEKLRFFHFLDWLREHHSELLNFWGAPSVEADVHKWFDDEIGFGSSH